MDGSDDDHLVSVHSVLVIGGYTACAASALFAVVLVLLPPGPVNPDGSLRYISNGMNDHCGFANAVLGTCSLFVLACQFVLAAVHPTRARALGAWALLQTVSWNVVMAVEDTGWTPHDVALLCFVLGNLMYHGILAQHPVYGGPVFRLIHGLACFFALLFGSLGLTTKLVEASNGGAVSVVVTLQSFAVAFEFVFMLVLSAQNACVVHALDQFQDIHLRLERPPPHY